MSLIKLLFLWEMQKMLHAMVSIRPYSSNIQQLQLQRLFAQVRADRRCFSVVAVSFFDDASVFGMNSCTVMRKYLVFCVQS